MYVYRKFCLIFDSQISGNYLEVFRKKYFAQML